MTIDKQIPWKRIGIEASAIVASILLAFAIDAWWDEQNQRTEEHHLLVALQAELAFNSDGATRFADRKLATAKSLRQIVDALESVPIGESAILSNTLLASAFGSTTYGSRRAVYDAMVQSGQMQLIENSDLREMLAGWPAWLEDAVENDLHIREILGPLVIRRLVREVSVPQVFDSLNCDPADDRGSCANRESSVRADKEIIGLIMMSHLYHQESARELALLANYTKDLTEMIEIELQSR